MLRAILNKSWRQHPTRHLPYIMKTIQVRWTRHAGHCWRIRDKLISDVFLWTPTYGRAKAGRPSQAYVRIWDVVLKTCQRQWMIRRSGERGSGISVLAAWHDDDTFCKSISPKIKVIAWIKFELTYYDISVKHISHYAPWWFVHLK